LLRRAVWWKFTDVSEVLAASIIRVITLVNFFQTTWRYNPEEAIFVLTVVRTSNPIYKMMPTVWAVSNHTAVLGLVTKEENLWEFSPVVQSVDRFFVYTRC
jgi:hypothetical protein